MSDQDGAKLERVRELLLGAHAQEQERRLAAMQTMLRDEVDRLESELRDRLASLETFVRDEVAALDSRLEREAQERRDDLAEQRRDLGDTLASIDRKLTELSRDLEARTGRLKGDLAEQGRSLRDVVEQAESRQARRLDAAATELGDRKVDRTALSALLNELASTLAALPRSDSQT